MFLKNYTQIKNSIMKRRMERKEFDTVNKLGERKIKIESERKKIEEKNTWKVPIHHMFLVSKYITLAL